MSTSYNLSELASAIEKLQDCLSSNRGLELRPSLSKEATKLYASISAFLTKADQELLLSSADYVEILALLNQAGTKQIATVDFLNRYLPPKEQLATASAAGKKLFAKNVLLTGRAKEVIEKLKMTPDRKWRDFVSSLAREPEKKSASKLNDLKDADLKKCLSALGIPVPTGKKARPKILELLQEKIVAERNILRL